MRLAALVFALALLGCGSSGAKSGAPLSVAASKGSHVFVIVMENKEHDDVIGSPSSPYVSSLARHYASAEQFYGVTHPSLPNYFALTAGTTFGVNSDCTGCQQSGRSIADQFEAAGVSWRAYMGGMPSACFTGAFSGQYAKKHNPFMYYRSVVGSRKRCASRVVPEGRLAGDLRAGRLARFSFLAPGLCDDTHDCPSSTGDRYLARMVPPILQALGPRGFLVLTWDEGSSGRGCCGGLAHGGRIATVIAGPGVRRGAAVRTPLTHYSTLRTIEDALALPRLRLAGDRRTKPLSSAFKKGVPHIR
ncbi:MAG: phosphatidylinositol-3-phosphatase [Thermoleophilaceae bacterium]|nr:phosphatidylinositol-3-phosphatase [Thermoleophilaceae bacterium]